MKMNTKRAPFLAVLMICVLALSGCSHKQAADGEGVYVTSVAEMMGIGGGEMGVFQRYAGVVEAQQTVKINLESGRTVKERYVEIDDEVKEGDPIFLYDSDDLKLSLEQKNLELERIINSIETQKGQIAELEKQAKGTSGDTLLQYTLQIQQATADLKQSEYEKQVKEQEIVNTQKQIDESIVVAPIDGIVLTINENTSSSGGDYYGGGTTDNSYMTIIKAGSYRIKGTVNEQNVYQLMVGTPVTIRSRVDNSVVWTGYIEEIDTNNTVSDQNNNYYGGYMDPMTQSSKYPFYVALDSFDGLMMGQHVYIEISGESTMGAPAHTDGVWVYEFYLEMNPEDPQIAYVLAEKNGKIERRQVTLGEYDPEMTMYEITDGLTQEDRIAFPDGIVQEGDPVLK